MSDKAEQDVLLLGIEPEAQERRAAEHLLDPEMIRVLAYNRLCGEDRQLLDYIWFGNLSGTRVFTTTELCAATHINESNVSRSLNRLWMQNLITKEKLLKGQFRLEINKDTKSWEFRSKKIRSLKRTKLQLSKKITIIQKPLPDPQDLKPKSILDTPPDYQSYVDRWNLFASAHGMAKVIELTDTRKRHLRARLGEKMWELEAIIAAIKRSDFLMGKNLRGWRVDFDFIITGTKYVKILEGGWDNAKPQTVKQPQQGYFIP